MAEGMFKHLVREAGLEEKILIDSAGTGGWHAGETPDQRMQQTARSHGIILDSRARKVRKEDFLEFDYILAMDQQNLQDLQLLSADISDTKAILYKMRYFDPQGKDQDVPDPYYGGQSGFEEVFNMVERSCNLLLQQLKQEHHW